MTAAAPAALVALLALGCRYEPDLGGTCAVRCAEASCPDGTSCRDDGYCHAGGASEDFEACTSEDDAGAVPDAAAVPIATRFHPVDPPRSLLAETLENHDFGTLAAAEPGVTAVLLRQDISVNPDGDVIWAIWPAGESSPGTPTMNVASGTHRMALAVSRLSPDGEIHYLVEAVEGSTSGEYRIDVIGEFREDGELAWQNAEPSRVFGPTSVATEPTDVVVPGDLEHAFLALHVQEPDFAGTVTASVPGDPPEDAQLRFEVDESLSASDLLPVGEDGMFQLSASAAGASVAADLLGGLVTAGEAAPSFHLVAPSTRLFDSRTPWGVADVPHKVPTGKTALDLAAKGVPSTAVAVIIHLAAFDAFDATAITIFGDPADEPAITTLQQEQGAPGWRITSALDIVPLAGDQLTIRNTAAPTHLVVDIFGYVE